MIQYTELPRRNVHTRSSRNKDKVRHDVIRDNENYKVLASSKLQITELNLITYYLVIT